jgi:hypothetical protein
MHQHNKLDKRSSLFCLTIDDGEKKFYKIRPWMKLANVRVELRYDPLPVANVIKLFSSSLTLKANKPVCLHMISLFGLRLHLPVQPEAYVRDKHPYGYAIALLKSIRWRLNSGLYYKHVLIVNDDHKWHHNLQHRSRSKIDDLS